MSEDYGIFFRDVVAVHLHKLVDSISGSHRQKILVHKWVGEIEKNWSEYVVTCNSVSEFVPRLSFWIGGLRDKFKSNPDRKEVCELLGKTFDASTFCYFEFGARSDVEEEIENYCTKVDSWMNDDVLTSKLKKFKLCKGAIPLINETITVLDDNGFRSKYIDELGIRTDIQHASELEIELSNVFSHILDEFIILEKTDIEKYNKINGELNRFLERCSNLGYTDLVTKSQLKELNEIKKNVAIKRNIRKIITESLAGLKCSNLDVPNRSIYKEFNSVFSNEIVPLEEKKIFLQLYAVSNSILEENREKGTEILNQISIMVETVNKSFKANYLRLEFNKIKDGAYLELKLLDFFRRPKKSIPVILIVNGVEINRSKTDKNGIIIFDNVPKCDILVNVLLKKHHERTYSIDGYYNSKILWLFTI